MRLPLLALWLTSFVSLAACATAALPTADALLLGELHDASAHQQRHRDTVQRLAREKRLAALALEMAEQGATTAGLPVGADESAVRAALQWNEDAWPWTRYAPAIMEAVRAGVPVLGANLPRSRMRDAMADAALDGAVPPAALAAQREAIREGHCGLLPDGQIPAMARIQIARDRVMARTVADAVVPGKTVLLVAGAGHVDEALGVPLHLPAAVQAKALRWPADEAPKKDHCAELRKQLQR